MSQAIEMMASFRHAERDLPLLNTTDVCRIIVPPYGHASA